jgi:hypothetical protein
MKIPMHRILILIINILFLNAALPHTLFSQKWKGVLSGDWNDPNNWEGGLLPSSLSTAVIEIEDGSAYPPHLEANVSIGSLVMGENTSINFNGFILTVLGKLEINKAKLANGRLGDLGLLRRESSMEAIWIQNSIIDVPIDLNIYAADAKERFIILGGCDFQRTLNLSATGLNGFHSQAKILLGYSAPYSAYSNIYRGKIYIESINTESSERGGQIYLEHHNKDFTHFDVPVQIVLGSSTGESDAYHGPLAFDPGRPLDAVYKSGFECEQRDFTHIEEESEPLSREDLLRSIWTRGDLKSSGEKKDDDVILYIPHQN